MDTTGLLTGGIRNVVLDACADFVDLCTAILGQVENTLLQLRSYISLLCQGIAMCEHLSQVSRAMTKACHVMHEPQEPSVSEVRCSQFA